MTETETLFNGRWLRIRKRGTWEFAERTNPGGAVIVVATTDADEVLFVEQYRVPIECLTIEMPAGLVGDLEGQAHEGVVETAQRELEEETGYRAGRIDFVMAGPSSAGMSNEQVAFVRARGLQRVGAGGGDETEEIVVHHVPREGVAAWLAGRAAAGYSIDPKLYAGLYFLERDARGVPWP
ncbi:MAG TPA: NUDIX hydrolase [Pseudomonadota bacterium]|nr:NUDIX hydrolase [Pseudomonadota bacterium]